MKINELLKTKSIERAERVAIYVPSTTDVNKAAAEEAAKMAGYTAEQLSKLFGGATATNAAGYWLSDNAGLVAEDVKIIYANVTEKELDEHAEEVLELAEFIKKEMKQEGILIEISGKSYII